MGPNPKCGVAIYIRDKFEAQGHYFLHNDFEEAIWCVVHLDRGEKLLVGVVYKSPNSSGNNNDSLLKLFEDVADSRYSHILIMETLTTEISIGLKWYSHPMPQCFFGLEHIIFEILS